MESEISDPSSLDAVLEQMEVSTGPDLESQDLITACAEDLHLGGEVEIRDRDAMETRQPSGAGSQKQRDERESLEAAGTVSAVTNFIFQGGAPGEEGEGVEDTIAMEIEVTRKSSSSADGSVSPAEPSRVRDPETGGGCGAVVVVASDAGGEQVEGNSVQEALEEGGLIRGRGTPRGRGTHRGRGTPRGRGTHRGRGRRRGLYIPPVTEWRDFLDSQDVLQEYARNVEREEGRKEEGESQVEVGKRSEKQKEREGEGREEQTDGEVRESVVKEVEGEEEGEREKEETEVEDRVFDEEGGEEGRTEGRREEDEEEISVGVENTGMGEEEHSDHPMQVGVEGGDPASKGAGDPDHLEMFLPSHVPLHRQALPASRAASTSGLSRCLEVAECFLDKERELLQKAKWVPSPGGDDSRQPLAQATNSDPTSVVLPHNVSRTEKSSPSRSGGAASTENRSTTPLRGTRRSSLTVSLPQSHDVGSTALQDENTCSDSSFLYHNSQMDTREGEEGERAVTLSSLSASSEYESAMETNSAGDSGPDHHEPGESGVTRRCTGKITLHQLTSHQTMTSFTQRSSEAENHTKGKKPRPRDCRVNVLKVPVDKIVEAYSSEERDIFDLLTNNISTGVPSTQGLDSWTSFHNFVDKLTLPFSTSQQRRNKTTSKSSKPLMESPLLEDLALFDSKDTQRMPGLPKADPRSAFNELVVNLSVPGRGAGPRVSGVTEAKPDHHKSSAFGLRRRKYDSNATPFHSQLSSSTQQRQVRNTFSLLI